MLSNSFVSWGKSVAGLLIVIGKSARLTAVVKLPPRRPGDLKGVFFAAGPGFIQSLFHGRKLDFQTVDLNFIPIFHKAYNKVLLRII